MILVDTNVWIDAYRDNGHKEPLGNLVKSGYVLVHPDIVGEIALGHLGDRWANMIEMLRLLPHSKVLADDDILEMVWVHKLGGSGIGWVDAHLIGSALVQHAQIWTTDRRLATAATRCGVMLFAGQDA